MFSKSCNSILRAVPLALMALVVSAIATPPAFAEDVGKNWKVYNVKIEGISLIENYRNTFNTEIQKSGVDGLIKALADKNRGGAQVTQR